MHVQLHINADEDVKFKDCIKALEEQYREERRRHREHQRVLESDIVMKEWAEKNFYGQFPITRRSQYGPTGVCVYQEFYQNGWLEDPRRPVVMRGSKYVLYRKHSLSTYGSSPNGWCQSVAERFFRRIKFTCIDVDEYIEMYRSVKHKLMSKHPANGRGWELSWRVSKRDGDYWINGKFYWGLTRHQGCYLHKLWKISQGLEAMDRTRELHGELPQ